MKHDLNIKVRDNFTKAVVRSNLFRQRVEKDKTKYNRKVKHKGAANSFDVSYTLGIIKLLHVDLGCSKRVAIW